MRIAVLNRDRCQPKRCALECLKYCPKVRTGDETIVIGDDGKPVISEELCPGCGICIHKCPFEAVQIIGLPEELEEDLVHQFGKNGFRLFRLPWPKEGKVIGLLGPNAIGKTTIINILSGNLVPNLGNYESKPDWESVLEHYAGTELFEHLKRIADKTIKTALKPQYVDKIPKLYDEKVDGLLKKMDEQGQLEKIIESMDLQGCLDRKTTELSGGELQRVTIAAAMLKDADIYFFDEPSSYLDIHQRLSVAKTIRELSLVKQVVVIEHDLAVLDFLGDEVYLMYGSEGAYGIIAQPRAVRSAINTYLSGYMREENMRFRDTDIRFEAHAPRTGWETETLISFGELEKRLNGFVLNTKAGRMHTGEVVGVVGRNSTGKTTFVRMLAGVIEPTKGEMGSMVKVSYKPQYLKPDFDGSVLELFLEKIGKAFESGFFTSEIAHPLNLKPLMDNAVLSLSGGELQRVAIALCLCSEADIYLIDEPSAYLDSTQRMVAARTIRRVMEKSGKSALIVDHDVYFIDLVSDSLMVFGGEPSRHGVGEGPFELREGMNRFLKNVGITFRRDPDTKRPRINKLDSVLDRRQKADGEYYYTK
ncbi:MAG: ribosome biogenesis/translation initiation ATPase RLI [Methanomassiliicoccales archaeon]|nr:MAG: ribosome biogenesis/translation initiation ATPase RLI [Methanomassiliicoccales archaeon]